MRVGQGQSWMGRGRYRSRPRARAAAFAVLAAAALALGALGLAAGGGAAAQAPGDLEPGAYLPLTLRGAQAYTPRFAEIAALSLPDTQRVDVMQRGLALRGDLAYLGRFDRVEGRAWVEVYDLSRPSQPSLAGRSVDFALDPDAWEGMDLAFAGDALYAAASDAGLLVFTLSDPRQPGLAFAEPIPNDAVALSIDGDRLVLLEAPLSDMSRTGERTALRVYDIARRAMPRLLGEATVSERSGYSAMAVGGDQAYLVSGEQGLATYDIAAPEAIERRSDERIRSARDAGLAGGRLLVSNVGRPLSWDTGLYDFGLAAPAEPALSAVLPLGDKDAWVNLERMAVDGPWAYAVDEKRIRDEAGAGLHAIDAGGDELRRDAFAPAPVANYWDTRAIAARNGLVLVATETALRVYRHAPPP